MAVPVVPAVIHAVRAQIDAVLPLVVVVVGLVRAPVPVRHGAARADPVPVRFLTHVVTARPDVAARPVGWDGGAQYQDI